MSMYVLTGAFNLVSASGNPASIPVGSASTNFPLANIDDGDPGSICKFLAISTDPAFQIDLDYLLNTGSMEAFQDATTPPVGWTESNTGTGQVARNAALPRTGTYCAEFTTGTGTASMYYDFTVRAGQRVRFDGWLRGDGATGKMEAIIQNLQTGLYCNPSGTWVSLLTAIADNTSVAYVQKTVDFAVEDYATCRLDTVVLRLTLINRTGGGSTTTLADDVAVYPAVTFSSVHGHNVDPQCQIRLRSSTDAFSGSDTLEATFTVRQPSFYTTISETFRRYWRLAMSGRQSVRSGEWWVGEWVLGQYYTLATGPAYDVQLGVRTPRIEIPLRVGAPATYQLARSQQRVFPVTFKCSSMTARNEILQEVFERSAGGAPLVVVPHHTDSFTEVIYGKLSADLPHTWATKTYVTLQTEIVEMAFPLITS